MKNIFSHPILFCIPFLLIIATQAKAQFAGGDGSSGNPYQITNANELHAMDNYTDSIYAGLHFRLINNIDLSTWISTNPDSLTRANGWKPIGSNASTFQGYFHGGGYTITGLWINRVGYVDDDFISLFSYLENGTIDSLNVEIDPIKGISGDDNIGGLVGFNRGIISNCHVTGKITGDEWVGGIAGTNTNGTIINSFTAINVTGYSSVGGIAGDNNSTITNCYASGTVSGNNVTGGLVGFNNDVITNSHTTINVTGDEKTGGLVGRNSGTLNSCYSNSNVVGSNLIGGLVGDNEHVFSNCFATGSVVGNQEVGGLIGYNNLPVSNSYATGSVSGFKYVGGLVGKNNDQLTNCYAMGKVSGNEDVGGLAGINYYPINSCYATGNVTGDSFVGGLSGENFAAGASVSNSLAANSHISGNTFVHRIEGDNSSFATSTNNYALNSMIVVINNSITNITGTNANSLDGSDIISGNIQASSTYTGTFVNWNFSTNPIIWDIWHEHSFPFLSWQSAPIEITTCNDQSITGIYRNSMTLDSTIVFKMETISGIQQFTHLGTITSGTLATNWAPSLQMNNVSIGDTICFLSYEQGKKASYPVMVRLSQKETIWLTNATNSNWNNPGNWSNGIPEAETFVIISGNANNYPELQISDKAVCDTILFEAGSEVAKTNFLTYEAAKIDLEVSANQWYMVAPALRNMYSGDYLLGESIKRLNPAVYFQVYQTVNSQTGKPAGSGEWSNPANNVLTSLNPGMGYAIKVDNGAGNTNAFSFHFPKDSTSYSYYDWNGNYTYQESGMIRTNHSRFIYEIGAGTPDDPSRAPADNSFSVPVTADHDSGSNVYATAIVGNPFMSHLDFLEFYNVNQTKISNSYHIWGMNGTSFESVINVNGTLISTNNDSDYIPPMQSFIVNKINPGTTLGTLNFTSAMSVTRPTVSLRSSLQEANILKLSVSRAGKRQSGIALYFKEGESNGYNENKDVWTFFADKIREIPILYALLDKNPASIYTFGNISKPIELGIRSTQKGALSIEIMGLESFDSDLDVYLEDRETQTSQNLRTTPQYSFINTTGNIEGRFFLKIGNKASTSVEDIQTNGITIYANNRQVSISSDVNDSIREIEVFDLQGKMLINKSGLNTSVAEFEVPVLKQICIVKVQTEKEVIIKKVFISQ